MRTFMAALADAIASTANHHVRGDLIAGITLQRQLRRPHRLDRVLQIHGRNDRAQANPIAEQQQPFTVDRHLAHRHRRVPDGPQ